MQAALRRDGVPLINWPPQSPDLNPIKDVWNRMKRYIRTRRPLPMTKQEYLRHAFEFWEQLTVQDYLDSYLSMPDRIQAVIQARGGATRY